MLFNSSVYIFFFLPIALAIYFILNRLHLTITAKSWLVLASLFFYGYWDSDYLVLLGTSILVNFFIGKEICAIRGKQNSFYRRFISRKQILIIGIVFNLGLLGYFKYAHFFIDNLNWYSGSDIQIGNIILPLAISFFTFQQIAFLVDSYRKGLKEHDFLNYCLFVTFFPQLIIGPIVHHKEMMPQFKRLQNKIFNWQNLALGIFIFSMGLFKKVFIADTFAVWADAGFDSTNPLGFLEAWGAALSFTFQIYYDFSGYTDMAIGAALMLNIRLPINFNSPYKSTNITEFWTRWHITLMRWMRDYLYIPLRKLGHGELYTHLCIIITFLVSGLWHGASWMFVIFGLMHGIAVSVHRVWKKAGFKMPAVLGGICTFLFFVFSLVLFRSTSLESAEKIYGGLVGLNGLISEERIFGIKGYFSPYFHQGISQSMNEIIIFSVVIALLISIFYLTFFHKNSTEVAESISRFQVHHILFSAFTLLFVTLANISTIPSEFIYFNF